MSGLSFDEMTRAIQRDTGVTRARAEAIARINLGIRAPRAAPVSGAARPLALPVRFTIPWSMLVTDNAKYGVANGTMILRPLYRAAKADIGKRVREQIGVCDPFASPVALAAMVFVPDNRVHDVVNFAKCVHDALEGVVYEKDRWLYRATWERAGVDVDAPRAEFVISSFLL